jgi:hypothetical protein
MYLFFLFSNERDVFIFSKIKDSDNKLSDRKIGIGMISAQKFQSNAN